MQECQWGMTVQGRELDQHRTSTGRQLANYALRTPDASNRRVDLEHLRQVRGALRLQEVVIQAAAQAGFDRVRFWASVGDDVFVTKASTLGT